MNCEAIDRQLKEGWMLPSLGLSLYWNLVVIESVGLKQISSCLRIEAEREWMMMRVVHR